MILQRPQRTPSRCSHPLSINLLAQHPGYPSSPTHIFPLEHHALLRTSVELEHCFSIQQFLVDKQTAKVAG